MVLINNIHQYNHIHLNYWCKYNSRLINMFHFEHNNRVYIIYIRYYVSLQSHKWRLMFWDIYLGSHQIFNLYIHFNSLNILRNHYSQYLKIQDSMTMKKCLSMHKSYYSHRNKNSFKFDPLMKNIFQFQL